MTLYRTTVATPVGDVVVVTSDTGIREIRLPLPGAARRPPGDSLDGHPLLGRARSQLDEYFRGTRRGFDLPLDVRGTDFQRAVWDALVAIPYGRTASYGEIAARIGRPGAARAVGAANARNPVPIVVPCHRVIGADGRMVGYGGPSEEGIALKRRLLAIETSGAFAVR
jgi:methylated-DNA-[protein]-cysteine S-methyltransferase